MRLYKRKHPDRVLPFEIAPMIDVVFLLIIFFMATAQYAKMSRAEVNLPQEMGEQKESPEEAGVILNITRDGQIIVGENIIALSDLRVFLQQEIRERRIPLTGMSSGGDVKFLLRVDRNADTAILNEVVTHLQQLGLGAVRIATEVPSRIGGTP